MMDKIKNIIVHAWKEYVDYCGKYTPYLYR